MLVKLLASQAVTHCSNLSFCQRYTSWSTNTDELSMLSQSYFRFVKVLQALILITSHRAASPRQPTESAACVGCTGQKRAREMWFLARLYNAQQAMDMGLINTVVPLERLEGETVQWCREMMRNSPTALRILKAAMNAAEDGQAGIQELGGNATMLFYQSEEGNEGREAYLQQRPPDFSRFPRLP